eukprot:TRINITY_DN17007_c0_g1_i1.p1 TRINITY_DN17007_c0_g1~~TRINITY_DN17007_c0_g1_i1.p1  ORF type:complete len:119 (+),score=25.93 TRINITY_DN17007_c0_g1_i1:256-612(+)
MGARRLLGVTHKHQLTATGEYLADFMLLLGSLHGGFALMSGSAVWGADDFEELDVLRTMMYTSAATAASKLWLMKNGRWGNWLVGSAAIDMCLAVVGVLCFLTLKKHLRERRTTRRLA